MKSGNVYLLDSSVLIDARRRHYGFDFCPGFWEALTRGHQAGRVFSIDRVHDELNRQQDELTDWANTLPKGFFLDSRTATIAGEFAPMMRWVQNQPQFTDAAKAEFASADEADGWLIAMARAREFVVATSEGFIADIKIRVPIPNVCRQFDVPYLDTFTMLRELKVKLVLA